MKAVGILNGPNLNRLGKREPRIYGNCSWESVWEELLTWGERNGCRLHYFQSNSEGELMDRLQLWEESLGGIALNAGGYTHTSVALRDTVAMLSVPVVEVHITNPAFREPFRHNSYLEEVCAGTIRGFGTKGYLLALSLLKVLVE